MDATFDPITHAATLNYLTYNIATPGNITIAPVTVDVSGIDTITANNLRATAGGTGPISGGVITGTNYSIRVNSGSITDTTVMSPPRTKLSTASPVLREPRATPCTISIGAPTLVSTVGATKTYSYSTSFTLPVSINQVVATGIAFAGDISAVLAGTFHGTGSFQESFTTPEPGTIVLLLGLAISLGGYRLWKRRGSR